MEAQVTPKNYHCTIRQIERAFKAGKRMTSCGCAAEFQTADLRKIVSILRREGLPIKSITKVTQNGKRFNEYFVEKATL